MTKYFGGLPRGQRRSRGPKVAPVTLADEKRLVYEDRVQVPRLYVQWPTVGEKSDDEYALDVLGAILTGPRTARLTKALVYDQQAAANVSARQGSNEDVGEFLMVDHAAARALAHRPRGGRRRRDRRLKADGPTAEEIQKAVAGEELGVRPRPRVEPEQGDDAGRRRRLPRRSRLLQDRLREDAGGHGRRRQARREQIPHQGRVVLSIVPKGKLDQAAKPGESTKVTENVSREEAGR